MSEQMRVTRRTIVKGAAWSVPVIVAATALPMASASVAVALAFTSGSYPVTGCTLTGVKVAATNSATHAALPGAPVTVALADGYTFIDGTTSFTGTTGPDGTVTLPDIKPPLVGATSTFTAVSGAASAVAPTTSPNQQRIWQAGDLPALPVGVTALQVNAVQGSTGLKVLTVVGSNGQIYQSVQDAGGAWGTWTNWGISGVTSMFTDPTNTINVGAVYNGGTAIFASKAALPALPGGVTVLDVQMFTNASGQAVILMVGSDGIVRQSVQGAGGAWGAWAPWALSGGTLVATDPAGAFTAAVHNSGTSVFAANAALPPLPAGVTATDISAKKLADGRFDVRVIGSDGNVYQSLRPAAGGAWGGWTKWGLSGATELFTGTVGADLVGAVSNGGTSVFAANAALPALPAGVTVENVQAYTNSGRRVVLAVGSDGKLYQSIMQAGATTWDPWGPWGINNVTAATVAADDSFTAAIYGKC